MAMAREAGSRLLISFETFNYVELILNERVMLHNANWTHNAGQILNQSNLFKSLSFETSVI